MPDVVERICTITGKGQTTVPKVVREALGVDYGGRIAFRVDGSNVTVRRVESDDDDPVLAGFLDLLAREMRRRPERIEPISPALAERISGLIEGLYVDPEEEIEGRVSL